MGVKEIETRERLLLDEALATIMRKSRTTVPFEAAEELYRLGVVHGRQLEMMRQEAERARS